MNNQKKTISNIKRNRATQKAKIFKGSATINAVWAHLIESENVLAGLTSTQLASVLEVANKAYQKGKTDSSNDTDDCLWVGDNQYVTHYSMDFTERCQTVCDTNCGYLHRHTW